MVQYGELVSEPDFEFVNFQGAEDAAGVGYEFPSSEGAIGVIGLGKGEGWIGVVALEYPIPGSEKEGCLEGGVDTGNSDTCEEEEF